MNNQTQLLFAIFGSAIALIVTVLAFFVTAATGFLVGQQKLDIKWVRGVNHIFTSLFALAWGFVGILIGAGSTPEVLITGLTTTVIVWMVGVTAQLFWFGIWCEIGERASGLKDAQVQSEPSPASTAS